MSIKNRTAIAVLLGITLAASSAAPQGREILTLSMTNGGAADKLLRIRLADGSADVVERLRRDPLAPRSRVLKENLFQVVGRPAGQAAAPGEIFLVPLAGSDGTVRSALYVESPIGYAAYFEDIGKGNKLGTVKTVAGRPFESVAATDNNFALLVRHDSSGRTVGAYLYHGTTGRAAYVDGLRRLETSLKPVPTPTLPPMTGGIAVAELHVDSEETSGYLVVDSQSGRLHVFDVPEEAPAQLSARLIPVNIFDVLPQDLSNETVTSPRRFELVPVQASDSQVLHVLLLDAVTGSLVLLENVADPMTLLLRKISFNLNSALGAVSGPRLLTPVPNLSSSGETTGVWVFDSQSDGVVYLSNPGDPNAIDAARAAVVP